MIAGEVRPSREAVVRLGVYNSKGQRTELDAVIDTGFTDFLTLPPDLIFVLDLPFQYSTTVILGDGSPASLGVFRASIDWNGEKRDILAHEAEGGPLIGMALLHGFRLIIDVVDGGAVSVAPLS